MEAEGHGVLENAARHGERGEKHVDKQKAGMMMRRSERAEHNKRAFVTDGEDGERPNAAQLYKL